MSPYSPFSISSTTTSVSVLCFILFFSPYCFSRVKSRMQHLIFPPFPAAFLGRLRPFALEAARAVESPHPGLLPEASAFEVRAVWELQLHPAPGSCSQGQNLSPQTRVPPPVSPHCATSVVPTPISNTQPPLHIPL